MMLVMKIRKLRTKKFYKILTGWSFSLMA